MSYDWSNGCKHGVLEGGVCPDCEAEFEGQPTGSFIRVVINLGGQTYEGEVDTEESFVAQLMAAQRAGKNPIDVMAYLADIGSHHVMDPENAISRSNRMGC